MLICTTINLKQRRNQVKIEKTNGNDSQNGGLIIRPCVEQTLSRNCSASPTLTESKRPHKKPPLRIFTLIMQPDTKTLVQNNIKRDPRKMPLFCQQYKQIKKEQIEQNETKVNNKDENTLNDLMVRGVEILSEQHPSPRLDTDIEKDNDEFITNTIDIHNYLPKELQIQLTDCCQCIRDVRLLRRELQIGQVLNNDPIKGLKNNEQNDTRQHHSTNLKPLIPVPIISREPPDSSTRRIIHVTMNNKKYN